MIKTRLGLIGLLGAGALGGAMLGALSTSSALSEFLGSSIGGGTRALSDTRRPDELRADGALPALERPLQANELRELTDGLRAYLSHRDLEAIPIVGKYALMGEPRAQGVVASMYLEGKDLPLDRGEGIRWLRLAAAQGGQAERDMLIAVTNAISEGTESVDPGVQEIQEPGLADGTRSAARPSAYARSLEATPQAVPPLQRRASALDVPSASRVFLDKELRSPSRVAGSTVILNRAGTGTYSSGNGDIYAQAGPHGVVNTRTGEFSPTN